MPPHGSHGRSRLVPEPETRSQVRHHRVRAFGNPGLDSEPAAPGALLLDRRCSLLRAICARSAPAAGAPFALVRRSLDRLRRIGARIGVASHNRGQGWDAFDLGEITAMHGRIEAVLGPIDLWCVCLIDPDGTCACDTPSGGVLVTAAQTVGVGVEDCAVATDDQRLTAATARAGAANLLRPTADGDVATAHDRQMAQDAEDLVKAVDLVVVGHALDPTTALRSVLA